MTTDTVSNTLLAKINEITKSITTCESESANTNNLNKSHIVEQLTRAYMTLNSRVL